MDKFRRFNGLAVFVTLVAWAVAPAQGGQSGGFGGAAGAVGAGNTGPTDTVTAKHILTPGERGEWDIDIKEGESVIVTIKSEVFDPAVEIVDAQERVLAENDDVAPGDQRAQVIYRFPSAGKYRVLVKAFQSKAGGQYEFRLRRFGSVPVGKGSTVTRPDTGSSKPWFRFEGIKAVPLLVTIEGVHGEDIEFVGPDGEQIEVDRLGSDSEYALIVPRIDGEHYINPTRSDYQPLPIRATINDARQLSTTIGTTSSGRALAAGEFDVWTFTANKGQLLHLDLGLRGRQAVLYIYGEGKSLQDVSEGFGYGGIDDRIVRIAMEEKSPTSLELLIKESGSFSIAVVPRTSAGAQYGLSLVESKLQISEGQSIHGTLERGTHAVYRFEGSPGQIVRLKASAQTFDSYMALYGPSGERIALNDDADGSLDSSLTAVLSEAGSYFVVVESFGGGGSGQYVISKESTEPKRASFGKALEGQVNADGHEVWSFDGKAGQTVLFNVRSSDFDAGIRIFGPDGQRIKIADGGDGSNPLTAIRLPADGRYTVWIESHSNAGRYILWMFDVGG